MNAALILLLDPRLSGSIEQLESELELAFEHRHEAALDLCPEDLLFSILLGACGQRRVLDDGEAFEALASFGGDHRGAVVAEQGARKPSFLEGLAEAVNERLGVLFTEVPLRMATEARMVVEDSEQERLLTLTARQDDRAVGLVEVEVPEAVDVRDLE
jgi:hypothetical protein